MAPANFDGLMGEKLARGDGGLFSSTKTTLVDGNIITSEGPGTALEFGLTVVKELYDLEKANEIGGQMRFQGKLE